MSNALLAFAAGAGSGYLNKKRQDTLDEERQADRAMRQQEFDARMAEANDAKAMRLSLAAATRPTQVQAGSGGMLKSDAMDNRDVGRQNHGQHHAVSGR